MKPTFPVDHSQAIPAVIEFSGRLELQITPATERPDLARITHVDVRLCRRRSVGRAQEEVAVPTVAGFRIPLGKVGEVAGKLMFVAEQCAEPERPR